ncbi:MAG: nickel/cobalt transporter [Rhodospirillales bacterium]
MRLILGTIVLLVMLGLPGGHAHADPQGTLKPPAETTAPAAQNDIGYTDRVVIWVFTQQRKFHRELTSRLREMAEGGSNWKFVWPLIAASFLYGIFHAAGPGHGKAVVSGYLLSHRQTVHRGIAIAVAGAFLQGVVAVVIVYGIVKLAGLLPRDAQTALLWSERASYMLVIALGGYLLVRAGRSILRRRQMSPQHAHDHGDAVDCGHTHIPTPDQLSSISDFRSAAAIVLSVGARPCTGAVIVLVFANVVSLQWAGVGAVLAMSAGTALTVSAFAVFAVSARHLLSKLSWLEAGQAAWAGDIVATLGGAVILLLGISLLSAALATSHPMIGL